jgi:hypothetical protein
MVGLLTRGNQRGVEEVNEFGSQGWRSLGNAMYKVHDYGYQGNNTEGLESAGTILSTAAGWLWWLVASVAVFEGAG